MIPVLNYRRDNLGPPSFFESLATRHVDVFGMAPKKKIVEFLVACTQLQKFLELEL